MKQAKVVEVRDLRASVTYDPVHTEPQRRARAEELLTAYPDVTSEEQSEIVDFLARGKHLDVGLVTGREEFKQKIEEIRSAHPAVFRMHPLQSIAVFCAVVMPAAYFVLPQLMGGR